MERWVGAALDYVPRWIDLQMRASGQPGCAIAVVHDDRVVLDVAVGLADAGRKAPLTTRHRFRVASHSKTFTAAGVLRLREQERLGLDDPIGRHVGGLHRTVAAVTIAQLLSHSGGIVRDGTDAGQWADERPFLDAAAVRADLASGVTIEPNTRFKYSNHGFALLGMAIEAVTGEPYARWMRREVVAAAGVSEIHTDAPLPRGVPLARGHGGRLPLGRRVVIPGDNPTNALAPATGFAATARDLARFFAQLSPTARASILSPASRRELTRRQWRDAYSTLERWYGLGTFVGAIGDWSWFGHFGAFPGTITRTIVLPAQRLAVSVLTNAVDGPSPFWAEGIVHVLRAFARHGAPTARTRAWAGRWWSLWGAVDLLPTAEKVLVATPSLVNPVMDAAEITPAGHGRGRITLASGLGAHGEEARLVRDARGRVTEVWLGGGRLVSESALSRTLERRYERQRRSSARPASRRRRPSG